MRTDPWCEYSGTTNWVVNHWEDRATAVRGTCENCELEVGLQAGKLRRHKLMLTPSERWQKV